MATLLLALAFLLAAPGSAGTPERAPAYAVADIQARFYYQETGAFGAENIASEGGGRLWNTMIGEGAATGPSGATLILVKLAGDWKSSANPLRLSVTARRNKDGPILLKQTVGLSELFTSKAAIWVPFIAIGTGCGHTLVSATLLDAGGAARGSLTRTIPFECGE